MHFTDCYMHVFQTYYSGIGQVHAFWHCCVEPRAILGALLFIVIVLLKHCRSSFVRHSIQANCNSGQHRCSTQLSFNRSQVHVCLQALSVTAYEREDLCFLLPPSIRPPLLVERYSLPYTPSVLVTGSDFVSVLTAATSGSTSAHTQRLAQLDSLPI
ncbi:TPA: hypothetical protein ACH3X1_008128 [Trebouxia sp. C0004]